MTITLLLGSLLAAAPAAAASSSVPWLTSVALEAEVGPVYVFRNDGRYGEQGTWYNASDVGQQRNLALSKRLEVELGLGERHTVSLLYAPVELLTRVTLDAPLVFNDTRFEAGTVVDHRYLFDGLRASYLFHLLDRERLDLHVGGVLQIRNAAVQFASVDGTQFASESDIGPVPALAILARYTTQSGVYGELEAVGLSTFGLVGGTEGGVLDASLTLGLPFRADADLFLRLRGYGGGADVPSRDLTNWGWFGAALAGVRVNLSTL